MHKTLAITVLTRMFCEHQTIVNFAMVDQFATIKSAKPNYYHTILARTQ